MKEERKKGRKDESRKTKISGTIHEDVARQKHKTKEGRKQETQNRKKGTMHE